MSTLGTYYLNAPSLASATTAYTDAALTTIAPDGWYSDTINVRELVSGVFTSNLYSCGNCAVPCNFTPINIENSFPSTYYFTKDVGGTVLDTGAVIVEISYNTNEYPVGIEVLYDGINYKTFSCQNAGRVTTLSTTPTIYLGRTIYDCGIAGNTYNASVYSYNPIDNLFFSVGASTQISPIVSQIATSTSSPGKYIMVVPKPTTYSTLAVRAIILCPSLTNIDITIKCPANLPALTSTENCPTYTDTCSRATIYNYYSADVNGTTETGGFLGLYDWVFYDSFGQSILADGWYRSPSCPAPYTSFEVQNGVIINFDTCGSPTQKNITYEVQNAITGACAANVNDLRLKISQPPISPYIDVSAYATGTTAVPEGITHAQLILDWTNTVTTCGQVRMVIEQDGSIIASKIFTPSIGIEYLDVDFTLTADTNIYAYVTLL